MSEKPETHKMSYILDASKLNFVAGLYVAYKLALMDLEAFDCTRYQYASRELVYVLKDKVTGKESRMKYEFESGEILDAITFYMERKGLLPDDYDMSPLRLLGGTTFEYQLVKKPVPPPPPPKIEIEVPPETTHEPDTTNTNTPSRASN